jgi:hypothetical protein
MNICDDLSADGRYIVVPAKISQGGLQFINPNDEHAYKCFRFSFREGEWPWVIDGTVHQWIGNPDRIVNDIYGSPTFLKAFGTAVPWSAQEVDRVIEVIRDYVN